MEEVCSVIKADAQHIRQKGNNENINFLKEHSGVFRSSCRIQFMQIIGDIDKYIDFKIFKVKVPIVFLSTVGFSLRMDGR